MSCPVQPASIYREAHQLTIAQYTTLHRHAAETKFFFYRALLVIQNPPHDRRRSSICSSAILQCAICTRHHPTISGIPMNGKSHGLTCNSRPLAWVSTIHQQPPRLIPRSIEETAQPAAPTSPHTKTSSIWSQARSSVLAYP